MRAAEMPAKEAVRLFVLDFRAGLLPTNRSQRAPSQGYVQRAERELGEMLDRCAWKVVAEFNGAEASRWLAGREGWGPATKGLVRSCVMQFGAWLVDQELVAANPFERLRRIPTKGEPSFRRCALAHDIVAQLATTTVDRTIKLCEEMLWLAKERALIYLLAAYCGMRRGEACGVLKRELAIDSCDPAILLPAIRSKNRRAARIEVPTFLAERIAAHVEALRLRIGRDLEPSDRIFPLVNYKTLTDYMQRDLIAAGIGKLQGGRVVNERGEAIDMHSLRHSYCMWLVAAGASPIEAQRAMRHSDIRLTLQTYGHMPDGALRKTIDSLPPYLSAKSKKPPESGDDNVGS